jgi:hypothetical protein
MSLTIPKGARLQQVSDDVFVIAETVDTLGKLLDKFHAAHGSEFYERLEAAFPAAVEFGGTASKKLHELSSQLEPRE